MIQATKHLILRTIIIGIALSALAPEMLSQTNSFPFKVLSTKRCKSFAFSDKYTPIEAKDPQVVLIVNVGGASGDKFEELKKGERPYLQAANGQRYDFDIISYSMYSHDPTAEIQLVAKVPRDIVDFMLFVGDHPIYFTAKEEVQDLISAHY